MLSFLGFMFIFSVLVGLIIFQYSLMVISTISGDVKPFFRFLYWIPILPYIILIFILFYLLFVRIFTTTNKFFELNFGWIFINGRKREQWVNYLREKYQD
jgi:hypothetical protein